jgi:uncharacterized OB-fold protein
MSTTTAGAGRPAPHVMPEAQAYWEGASQGKLLIKRCTDCGQPHFYPRDICPHCGSAATEWVASQGRGGIYSFSTSTRGERPHTIAFIALDEGVTMMSNLVDCDPATLSIGQRVRVVFAPTEGHALPMFTPEAS